MERFVYLVEYGEVNRFTRNLNKKGRIYAENLAVRLQNDSIVIDLLACSKPRRCRQTLEPLSRKKNIDIEVFNTAAYKDGSLYARILTSQVSVICYRREDIPHLLVFLKQPNLPFKVTRLAINEGRKIGVSDSTPKPQ